MNAAVLFKKQGMAITLSIILVAIVFIGLSYSLFIKNLTSEENVVVKTGNLVTTFNGGTALDGELLPMSDDDAIDSTDNEYTFTISNDGTFDTSYKVVLYVDKDVEGTHIPHQYIHLKFDDNEVQTLSNVSTVNTVEDEIDKEYLIGSDVINLGVKNEEHKIKLWLSDQTPVDNIGNIVSFKVKILSEINK